MTDQIWRVEVGEGPLVALAIHDGHGLREELLPHLALDDASRLREEDPHTGSWAELAPTRFVGLRSRFEVDLNRPRELAVYLTPADAWGLKVWEDELPPELIERSLAGYDAFYAALASRFDELVARHGAFVVFDLHSYNHRRDGAAAPAAGVEGNPQVNVGTGTMSDRAKWAGVIDRVRHDLTSFDFPGGGLDVRENVRFRGGACARWIHDTYPESACVLSLEFKKFFMDEWTGKADPTLVAAIGEALRATVPGVLEEVSKL